MSLVERRFKTNKILSLVVTQLVFLKLAPVVREINSQKYQQYLVFF